MSCMKKYIDIVPIFNQTPLFWSTFVDIQRRAMFANYRYATSQEEQAFEISQLRTAWSRFKSHFAFAAYDNANLVAFINGIVSADTATVKGLYVLPKYQKIGTGARLLAAAERAASIHVGKMGLFAVDGAEKFYESHKYTLASKTGLHSKSVFGASRDTVVPVFWCRPEMASSYQRLAAHYDLEFSADDVNKHHAPMFAYIDKLGHHTGYILGGWTDGGVRVAQLCTINDSSSSKIARHLIEAMAKMNFR